MQAKFSGTFFSFSMSDDDYSEEEARLRKQMDDSEGSDAEEPYSAPHCSTCHDPLSGVGAKAHKKECPGDDKHKMVDCPHPGTRWRKTHHVKESRIQRQIDQLRRKRAKKDAHVSWPDFAL
jgi:hypothetical protein